MHEHQEMKIVFTGPMGAGKSTAIRAISDIAPVSTDVENIDRSAFDKETTTVALDFGQIVLDDGRMVRLYGTPGQKRFEFMWQVLGSGALGVILLLDATQVNALAELDTYLDAFDDLARSRLMLVGVGRSEAAGAVTVPSVLQRLRLRGLILPVFSVDVRRREDVLLLIDALLSLIEAAPEDENPQ
jgi:signal recognition particle receptor subunit beta